MSFNETESFKNDFFKILNNVKSKLAKDEKLTDEDYNVLLMASILEEEG